VLPVEEFPQFASAGAAEYVTEGVDPFAPIEGTRYAGALHQDGSYMRLATTVDLTGATAAQLRFQLSINTEPSYDNVIVEAHTVGQDNWTTLADLNGGTQTSPPAEYQPGGTTDAPLPRALPGRAGLRQPRHARNVELVHRHHGRMAPSRVQPD
jgi:hypothetical protein